MDNPQEWARLPDLPDEWVFAVKGLIAESAKALEKAKTIDDIRTAQGEIKAYRAILAAKKVAADALAIEAKQRAEKAAQEAEIEQRRGIPAWERCRNAVSRYKHRSAGT
jgi:nucleotide-binding universal stress UspA family protein